MGHQDQSQGLRQEVRGAGGGQISRATCGMRGGAHSPTVDTATNALDTGVITVWYSAPANIGVPRYNCNQGAQGPSGGAH